MEVAWWDLNPRTTLRHRPLRPAQVRLGRYKIGLRVEAIARDLDVVHRHSLHDPPVSLVPSSPLHPRPISPGFEGGWAKASRCFCARRRLRRIASNGSRVIEARLGP
jgi:hypothetical protein